MANYSFSKKKIKVLESVKLKQQEVSSEVLVTAIDAKCNFTEQINANQGKMLNIVIELLGGGGGGWGDWKRDTSKAFLKKTSPTTPPQNFRVSESENK